MASEQHERFADFLHNALLQNISIADRKSGIVFTLVAAAVVFLFSTSPETVSASASQVRLATVLWIGMMLFLIAAAVCAFLVIYPRVRGRTVGMLDWGAISGHADPAAFVESVTRTAPDELFRMKLENCYQLSRICKAKFSLLRYSLTFAAVGLVLFVAANLLISL